jgi:tRNA 2-thiouridine synthesizing protein A
MMTEISQTIDALGLLCPLPVLKARKRLKSVPDGGVVKLLADDPAAVIDVPHFCAQSGHELLAQFEEGSHQVYLIQKAG